MMKSKAYRKRGSTKKYTLLLPTLALLLVVLLGIFLIIYSVSLWMKLALPKTVGTSNVRDRSIVPVPAHDAAAPVLYTYRVIREFYHDSSAFTQGLLYADIGDEGDTGSGLLYESTGMWERTSVRVIDPHSGNVMKMVRAADWQEGGRTKAFGEGLALVMNSTNSSESNPSLLQLTWKSNVGFAYDAKTLEMKQTFQTDLTDGWGLTGGIRRSDVMKSGCSEKSGGTSCSLADNEASSDDMVLAATDSGIFIFYLDPMTMKTLHKVEVTDGTTHVPWLNELEFIKGYIWANVFTTDCIAIVEPKTGIIRGWVDMTGLQKRLDIKDQEYPIDVLNGIAHDVKNDRLFVTGKQWSKMFEVEVIEMDDSQVNETGGLSSIRKRCIPIGRQLG